MGYIQVMQDMDKEKEKEYKALQAENKQLIEAIKNLKKGIDVLEYDVAQNKNVSRNVTVLKYYVNKAFYKTK